MWLYISFKFDRWKLGKITIPFTMVIDFYKLKFGYEQWSFDSNASLQKLLESLYEMMSINAAESIFFFFDGGEGRGKGELNWLEVYSPFKSSVI